MGNLLIKRAYEAVDANDGKRVLVDRMWPRGIKKEKLALDLWEKSLAPTSQLRKKFGHDPQKFSWFKKEYQKELEQNDELDNFIEQIKTWLNYANVTLIYSAKDQQHNQAVVLQEYLNGKLNK
ncbi:MAG TPA: DUF488 family protein [Tetragenococcus sp.]|nr:DUF488 family protein [Tetragenococcus sp.]